MSLTTVMNKIGAVVSSETWGAIALHAFAAATIILSLPAHAKVAGIAIMAFAVPKEFWWDLKYEPAPFAGATMTKRIINQSKDFAGYALGTAYGLWFTGVI